MILIDDNGMTYIITKDKYFLSDGGNDLLTNAYKSTLYWYHLNSAMNELVDKGIMKQKVGDKYNTSQIKTSLKRLKKELINRFGIKGFNQIYAEVDLSFLDNKPKKL